jgi:hypothetical protein
MIVQSTVYTIMCTHNTNKMFRLDEHEGLKVFVVKFFKRITFVRVRKCALLQRMNVRKEGGNERLKENSEEEEVFTQSDI